MEARINDAKEHSFILNETKLETKDYLSDIKNLIDNLTLLTKHETADIRKELTYLATKQESAEIKYELKESVKALEMKLYTFVVKAVVTTIGLVTAIQPIFSMLIKSN